MPKEDAEQDSLDVGSDQVADVYAKAFLGAAVAAGETDARVDALDRLVRETVEPRDDFLRLLGSAFLAREEKEAILDRVFAGRIPQPVLVFLKVLAAHDRLALLPAIRRRLLKRHHALRGRVEVSVESAQPLDSALRGELTTTLERILGSKLELSETTNPSLIGGLVVRVGDRVFDSSIATQLARVRDRMIQHSKEEIDRDRDRFVVPSGEPAGGA